MPQFEQIVRFHLQSRGIKTLYVHANREDTEHGLNYLIGNPNTVDIFGLDWCFEVQALFCAQIGANLRNRVAHGLVEDAESLSPQVVYAWWFILRTVVRESFPFFDPNRIRLRGVGNGAGIETGVGAVKQSMVMRGPGAEDDFFRAVQAGELAKVRLFIEGGRAVDSPCEGYGSQGRTPLYWAVVSGHLPVVRYLIDRGADWTIRSSSGRTVLLDAVYFGQTEIVTYLVEEVGMDVQDTDRSGEAVLHRAVAIGDLGLVRYLVKKGGMCLCGAGVVGCPCIMRRRMVGWRWLVIWLVGVFRCRQRIGWVGRQGTWRFGIGMGWYLIFWRRLAMGASINHKQGEMDMSGDKRTVLFSTRQRIGRGLRDFVQDASVVRRFIEGTTDWVGRQQGSTHVSLRAVQDDLLEVAQVLRSQGSEAAAEIVDRCRLEVELAQGELDTLARYVCELNEGLSRPADE